MKQDVQWRRWIAALIAYGPGAAVRNTRLRFPLSESA